MRARRFGRSGPRTGDGGIAITSLVAWGLLALGPGVVAADGGFFGTYHSDVYEPAQRALIVHDPEAGHQDLYIQGDYEGTTDEFAWIIPVPALPALAAAPPQLFPECADLTRVLHEDRDSFGCSTTDTGVVAPTENGVDVYATERVGIYDTMILGASDAAALADSLEVWGYLHDRNRQAALAAFQFYIDKDWYFVALRTDTTRLDDPDREGYRYGGIDPIRLSFASAEPVYPLRISAMSASPRSQVLVYACAPHRMTFDGAVAEYANRISKGELGAIQERYPNLGAAIGRPCFLTKLRRSYAPDAMTDDLVLERAPDDREFRRVSYSGVPMTEMLLLAIALGAYRRIRRPRCSDGEALNRRS